MVWIVRPFAALMLATLAACSGARPPERADARAAPAPVSGPVHFLQETRAAADGKEALGLGVLTLDPQGCLRLNGGEVLVWPAEAALDLSEPGVVRIFDRRDGASIRVGDRVALGGGSFPSDGAPLLNRPAAPCGGGLWDVDSFQSAAEFEALHGRQGSPPGAPPSPPGPRQG